MQKLYKRTKNFFSKVPFSVWVVTGIQAGFILVSKNKDFASTGSLLFYVQLFKTILNIALIFYLIAILLSGFRKISGLITILTIYIYTFLILYHYSAGANLEFKLLWDFKHDLLNIEVFQMIGNFIGFNIGSFLIILALITVVGQIKWKLFSSYNRIKKPLLQFFIIVCAVVIINISPAESKDEIANFSRSVKGWYRIQSFKFDTESQILEKYPYIKAQGSLKSTKSNIELPNIFFIVIESFNDSFVEKKTNDGREITPFFDSLIPKGIYIEHFYGNSVITVKGHVSILLSILPSYRGLESEEFYSDNFQSLPEILKSVGYKTIFFLGSGPQALKFQNEGPFWAKNGFDLCKGVINPNKNYIKNNKNPFDYNNPKNESGFGGYKDYVLYKQFFSLLDSLHYKNNKRKYFGFLSTYSSHIPWLRERGDSAIPFPNSNSQREDFANSLFHVDSYLKTFFNELRSRKYLENSIIMITGDHSSPSGERGNFYKGKGFYEENFRIPFLLLWENNIEPMRIKEQAWSQIDIAPTILDLLNINVVNHFIGRSFLKKELVKDNIVLLSQSFGGLNLAIIDYPYKYIYDIPANDEYLFNLKKDPNEVNNIIGQSSEKLNLLRGKISLIELNQYLLEHNRVWNESSKEASQYLRNNELNRSEIHQ